MFISVILDKETYGASLVVTISNTALFFSSSAKLAGLKDLVRQTDIGLAALSAIGMVADGFHNRYNPLYVEKEVNPKKWEEVVSCVLGGLLLVDTAAKVGLVTLSKFSLSVKGRELTNDAFSTSITVALVVFNLLKFNSARVKANADARSSESMRNYKWTFLQVGFKLFEIGTDVYYPAQKAAIQAFKGCSALAGLINLAG